MQKPGVSQRTLLTISRFVIFAFDPSVVSDGPLIIILNVDLRQAIDPEKMQLSFSEALSRFQNCRILKVFVVFL